MWVTSSESAENADVAVVVYGDKGSSGRIILGKARDKELFRAGNMDEFKVVLCCIIIITMLNCWCRSIWTTLELFTRSAWNFSLLVARGSHHGK
jgi:hypothetical protein